MNQYFLKSFFALTAFLTIYAYSSSKKVQIDTISEDSLKREQAIVPDTFVLPHIPDEMTNSMPVPNIS